VGKPVTIHWPAGFETPIFLRAINLRQKLYYRMDARRPAASLRFDWPSDVLKDLALNIDDVGIVGWSERKMGERVQDVYVPLRLGNGPATTDRYVLEVVSGSDLRQIYVRLATADSSGREQRVVIPDQELKRGFYPAERAIPIPIAVSTLKERGLYRLQLNAVSSTGRPSSRIVYFHHVGS
jgi:hypothetical protein